MPKYLKAIISIVLVLAAILVAKILIASAPVAERKRPPKMAPLVDIEKLRSENQIIRLHLTGTVTPAESIKLQSRVSGEIISMHPEFMDGGHLKKGEKILSIDPVDYELALADAEAKLAQANFELKQELGRQEVAKREWELLKFDDASELEKELALRKPHLESKEAAVVAAEANLKKARVNLERTGLSAPFNAVVLNRKINLGSQATPQSELAELVGTDAYWITVSIPVDRLSWVSIPGSMVRVESTSGAVREGTVIKLLGDLEEKGRMARLLVEVQDPLCVQPEHAGLKPLLLGEFVKASIAGRELKNVFTIPRNALREGSVVWLATPDDKLDIRDMDVLWRDSELIILRDGLSDGESLIVSDIYTPIQGMDVNTGKKRSAPPNKKPAPQQ